MLRLYSINILLVIGMLGGLMACEEESTYSKPTRRSVGTYKKSNRNQAVQYNQVGNGPQRAPDWISNQDPNVIRRFTNKAVSGFRNGNTFEPKSIVIEQREMGWYLVINEHALSYPTQLMFKGQRIEIPLQKQPSDEFRQQASFAESKSEWRIPTGHVVGKTLPWIAESAYTIEILEWETKPYQKQKGVFQVAGQATGRVVIHFVDVSGIQGWVSGRFEQITVRYMGNPEYWVQAH